MDAPSAGYGIDGSAFLQRVEEHLSPIAPIMSFVVKKQMSDLNATPDSLTPEIARRFIDRMVSVLRTFAPVSRVEEIRDVLLREFRKAAPQFAEQMLYGGRA
ncbi:MAG: hypothetical protein AABY30_03685 [Candidatus Thermoplasmatota archaeon]